MVDGVRIIGIPGIPRITEGDDVGEVAARCMEAAGIEMEEGDLVVVAQTVVSRSEGCTVRLDTVNPSGRALSYAGITGKDPRIVEVVLGESTGVIHAGPGFLLCETRHGFVCANAGVDSSNVEEGMVTTLPPDPDGSAARISRSLGKAAGFAVPVIVSDSEGRPFRRGSVGVALGVAGISPVRSLAGVPDFFGRQLQTTEVALADQICSAANLVMGESGEGIPVAIARGVPPGRGEGIGGLLYEEDVFKEALGSDEG